MKYITLALAGALLFALPQQSNAAEQCTTSELDLMCDEGQVLRGIDSTGKKNCVAESAGGSGVSVVTRCTEEATSYDYTDWAGCEAGEQVLDLYCQVKAGWGTSEGKSLDIWRMATSHHGQIANDLNDDATKIKCSAQVAAKACARCLVPGNVSGNLYQCPTYTAGQQLTQRSRVTDSNCYGQKSVSPSCSYNAYVSNGKSATTVTRQVSCSPIN